MASSHDLMVEAFAKSERDRQARLEAARAKAAEQEPGEYERAVQRLEAAGQTVPTYVNLTAGLERQARERAALEHRDREG